MNTFGFGVPKEKLGNVYVDVSTAQTPDPTARFIFTENGMRKFLDMPTVKSLFLLKEKYRVLGLYLVRSVILFLHVSYNCS
jgi:hypothetical protein